MAVRREAVLTMKSVLRRPDCAVLLGLKDVRGSTPRMLAEAARARRAVLVSGAAPDALEIFRAYDLLAGEDELNAKAPPASAGKTCSICLGERADHALRTCGHVYCAVCIGRFGGRCAFCRKEFEVDCDVLKLHFP